MKKILALVMSLLLSVASLAACGNGDAVPEQPAADTTTTTAADAPTTDMPDTTESAADTTDGGETADSQTETSADNTTAPTKDTVASTIANKATSATGKPKSTVKTKQPTVSKTQSTKNSVTKADYTKNTTTGKTKPPAININSTTTKNTTGKTEPKKTTSTMDKAWPVIVVDMQDDYFYRSPDYTVLMSLDDPCVSPALTELMDAYDGMDVLYSVIVEIPNFREDQKQYNEEMAQINEEYIINAAAFEEEAKRLDPSYDYNKVNVWSDKLRELYDNMKLIQEKEDAVIERGRKTLETYRKQRLDKLKTLIGKEPVPISTDNRYHPHVAHLYPDYVFFMELTADEINTLAEQGGYIIRLKRSSGDRG